MIFLELLVVVAIFAIVFAGAVISLNSAEGANHVQAYRADLEEVQALIAKAHAYARAARLDDHWGIRRIEYGTTLCGASSVTNCFVLFKGNKFDGRDTAYDEVVPININLEQYEEPDNENEIFFQKNTGWGRGFIFASSTDETSFRFRSHDGTFDCQVMVSILGTVYDECES